MKSKPEKVKLFRANEPVNPDSDTVFVDVASAAPDTSVESHIAAVRFQVGPPTFLNLQFIVATVHADVVKND